MKILVAALLLAAPALADDSTTIEIVPTCVTIDVEHDALLDAERADARERLVRALELQDRLVVTDGCQDTITLWHERVEDAVVVHLRSSLGARKLRVSIDADVYATYARMARALYEAPPPVVEARPAAALYEVPQSDVPGSTRNWYYRLGYGSLGDAGALAIVVGYRSGSSATVADISFALMRSNAAEVQRRSSSLRGQVLRFSRPQSASSIYWGGGASFASSTYEIENMTTTESGMQLEGTLGFEWNRDSDWRFSLESNLGLPFYSVGDRYPASLAISFGVAH